MLRTKIATLLVGGITLVVAFSGISSAQAEELATCTSSVVDATSDHVLDVSAVDAAIEAANANGADFYVRAFNAAPKGSLDAYWQNSVSDCANWRNGSADSASPKGNVVMVAFSMDHESAIFFGPGYNQTIGDSNATAIRTEMNGFFKAGDFTGGVVHATQALAALTDPARAASESSSEPSAPIDLSWMLWILWAGLALLALCVVVWLMSILIQRKKDRIYRDETRLEAIAKKDKAAKLVNEWEKQVAFLTTDFLPSAASLPKKFWSQPYEELLGSAVKAVHRASGDYAKYKSSVDLDNTKLDLRSYVQVRNGFGIVNDQLQKVGMSLKTIKEQFAEDVYGFSFEGQTERAMRLSKSLDSIGRKLQDYNKFFSTSIAMQTVQRLQKQLVAIQLTLAQKADAAQSFDALETLERELNQLSGEVSKMNSVADNLSDPSNTLAGVLTKGRSQLDDFSIDTDEEARQLGLLEQGIDEVLHKFDPTRSYDRQLSVIESFQRRVQAIVSGAQVRETSYRKEQEKKLEKERQRKEKARRIREQENRRSQSYGSSNSSDALIGGLAGGYLGSSLGHSSSSSSSSSSDFGGGSSGGWGGGGGDFGGGSSGSW